MFIKQSSDLCFVDERISQNAEYIEQATVEMAVMFGNSDKAVGTYGTVDLYPDDIFEIFSKGLDIQMPIIPFEKNMKSISLFKVILLRASLLLDI